jgi:hypothetical protein
MFEVLREGSSGACTLELDRRIFAREGTRKEGGSNVAQEGTADSQFI